MLFFLNFRKLHQKCANGDASLNVSCDVYSCNDDDDVEMVMLSTFCSEGNNTPEAVMLVTHLDQWCQLLDKAQVRFHHLMFDVKQVLPLRAIL